MRRLFLIPLLAVILFSGCTGPDGFPILAQIGSIQGPPPAEDPKLGLSIDKPISFCISPFEYQNVEIERQFIAKRFHLASIVSRKHIGVPGFHYYVAVGVVLQDGRAETIYFLEWGDPAMPAPHSP
jgi:hypothetical protein